MKKQLFTLFALCFLAWGAWAQTSVNMPGSDGAETTVNITDPVTFYDAGGEAGNIPIYQITGITFTPRANQVIRIVFETIDLQGGSLIKAFEGAKALNKYWDSDEEAYSYSIPTGHKWAFSGTKSNVTIESGSADGKITVCFQNSNGSGAGWKATVSSIERTGPPPALRMPSNDKEKLTVALTDPKEFLGPDPQLPGWKTSGITFTPRDGEVVKVVIPTFALTKANLTFMDDDQPLEDLSNNEHKRISLDKNGTNFEIYSLAANGKLTLALDTKYGPNASWTATASSIPRPAVVETAATDPLLLSVNPAVYTVSTPVNFYDDGGKNGKISLDFDGKVTFKPSTPGQKVKVEFTKLSLFNTSTIGKNDILKVYNGSTVNEENLLTTLLTAPTPVVLKSTAADGSLTITLKSKTGYPGNGFEAMVSQFTPAPMTFNTVELSQYTSGTVCAGDKNQAILSVNVKTTDDLNALSAEKFAFTTNSTFAQVEKATLYYTGKNNSFTTSHKVGEANITADDFEISCSAPQVLFEGNNYFWLAYDLKADATNGQTMDAGCTAVTVSGAAHPVATPQPEGNRTVKNEYISTVGSFEKNVSGSWAFTHTVQSQYNSNYKAEMGDQIVTFVPATNGKVMEIDFADFDLVYASNTYQTRAKFEIFSGKTTSGEKLWEVNADNKSTGPGKTIRSKSLDGALTIVFNANTTYSTYTAKGWHATVNEYLPQPMQFSGSTAFQTNTNTVKPGAVNQELIGIEILTTGDQSPLTLNELVLNLKGSHDKIKKVSVFSTGDNKAFDTKTLVGEALAPANSALTLTPTAPVALAEGKNYFWVAYDMKDVLASDQVIDAALESLKINNEVKLPTTGDPDGLRIIKNIYEFENGTHTVEVASSLMFYDNGGPNGPYTAAAKGTVTFVPQPGKVIKMVFKSFQTPYGHKFYVHNGGVDEPQIAELKGNLNSSLPAPILSTADDGSLTVKFAPSSVSTSPDGWEIEVISYTPQPLSISSVNVTAVSADKLLRGAKDEPMLKIKVEVTGDKGNINLNTFSFDTEGTTAAADIAAATLYHSGTEEAFSTANPYAAALTQAPFTFNGNTAITKAGVYVFWLTYDVASTAATGNVLKAKLTTVEQAGTPLAIIENTVAGRTVQDGFSGTYTIGTSSEANYNTFAAAIAAMQQGIDGKVVFEVEDGTYSQLVKIPHIPGASAENTITFRSKSNDYNKATIEVNTAPGTSGDKPGIFTVDGADYLSIEGFSIKTNKAKYPAVVLVRNVSNHVTVKNCMIQAPRSTSYSFGDIALVRVEGLSEPYRNCDYFTLENSKLDGGYTGAYIYGTANVSLPKQKGARIADNEFTNQGNMAVYLTKEHDGIVENNRIRVSGTTASTFKGIDAVMIGNTTIRGNRIYADNTTTKAVNGLYLRRRDSDETLAGRNRVYNNEIIIDNANGSPLYGIFFADGLTNTDIAYNSVNIVKSTAVQQSAPILIDRKVSSPNESVTVENNLFQNNAGGYVYRVNSATAFAGVSFSNNGLYTSGSTFAYGGTAIAAFDAWQTASGETNSLVEQAQFLSAISLDLTAKGNLLAAKPIADITTDINGTVRHAATPTIGAYEFTTPAMPAMAENYPKVNNITHRSADITVKLTENGKVFMLLRQAAEAEPSQAEVLAGDEKSASKNAEVIFSKDGLESLTEYKAYFVLRSLGDENSAVTASAPFTTEYTPTQISDFEQVTVTEGDFTDGTARFSGFKVVTIADGVGTGNTKAAQLESNGTITITNHSTGLRLTGFFFKADAPVVLEAKKGSVAAGSKTLAATNGKWVFIDLKEMNEITSVTLTGAAFIDNFSGTPLPLKTTLADVSGNAGDNIRLESNLTGGVQPYTYRWINAKNTTLSTEAHWEFTATLTMPVTMEVVDAWGSRLTKKVLVSVTGGQAAVASFEDLYLAPESRWWGDETSTSYTSTFYSGSYSFSNMLMLDYNTWGGFGYSNFTSTGFENFLQDQFRSAVGHGVDNSENYAVVYLLGGSTKVTVTNNPEGEVISGFYITNNAWVKHASLNGTGMESADDPTGKKPFGAGDWYKITVKGDNNKTVDFYPADYRSEHTEAHYTLDTWQWVDLRSLGKVKNLTFSGDGTRRNTKGTTIPLYFCMDNLGGKRHITDKETQAVQIGTSRLIPLSDIFGSTIPVHADCRITDNIDAALGQAIIEGDNLKLVATGQADTEIILQKTEKGQSVFVRVPLTFSPTTHLESLAGDAATAISLSPNPARNVVRLNVGGNVAIYSAAGLKVYEKADYESGAPIRIDSWDNGVYVVRINNRTLKLIKR